MSNHVGLALRKNEHGIPDLSFVNGRLETVENAEAVGQHAAQRLKSYHGEWFLDTSSGMMWLEQILGHSYDPVLAEALIKAHLLDSDGVESIESFSVSFDRVSRGLSAYSISILTEYDEEVSI